MTSELSGTTRKRCIQVLETNIRISWDLVALYTVSDAHSAQESLSTCMHTVAYWSQRTLPSSISLNVTFTCFHLSLCCSGIPLWQTRKSVRMGWKYMSSMKLAIPLYFISWKKESKWCRDTTTPESIHTKDESKRGSAFGFIFGVNWPVLWMWRNDKFHGIHDKINWNASSNIWLPTVRTLSWQFCDSAFCLFIFSSIDV